ncbi:hypothetical protein TVAGG3_0545440 [Trichomonas vaginalis G3]|uniref:hypothetical protein n=1 Tax=Trichomonas vaginalis (strain ATCC PRA-98 / G3) TaxID=412133 RepID=UPI0021E5A36A|nr:hypothetical protein TVAGG3_0545440 [Trichomonas vaginalis G3]KAI5520145.1 hypothetical protein TVAGG3_0545440 [Trichomonas vaginalis G3]
MINGSNSKYKAYYITHDSYDQLNTTEPYYDNDDDGGDDNHHHNKAAIIITIILAVALCIIGVVIGVYCYLKRRKTIEGDILVNKEDEEEKDENYQDSQLPTPFYLPPSITSDPAQQNHNNDNPYYSMDNF